jgi:oligopeptide/dipeptide ABC transporter ATP-binding protein
MVLMQVKELVKHFPVSKSVFTSSSKVVHAVDGVNLDIDEKETVGLVGESGCGKTTLGRLVLGLMKPSAGAVHFMGQSIFDLKEEQLRRTRRDMQIVFQDPFASLNPRKTLRQILRRPFIVHGASEGIGVDERVTEILEAVGLSPAETYIDRYPHELSGGQKQRVGIARALALRPKFVVADEPVSSLDLSVRAQVLMLMKRLGAQFGCSYLFITHDLSVVRSFCDRVAIMYLGKIVELSQVDDLFSAPAHPYTRGLLEATPIPNPKVTRSISRRPLTGEVPSQIDIPKGCRFNPRCPIASEKCSKSEPQLQMLDSGHSVACFKPNEKPIGLFSETTA